MIRISPHPEHPTSRQQAPANILGSRAQKVAVGQCKAAHLRGRDDIVVRTKTLLEINSIYWKRLSSTEAKNDEIEVQKKQERMGRPAG